MLSTLIFRFSLTNQRLNANHTMKLVELETLCQSNRSMTNVEQHLTSLLARFEISKSQFASSIRIEFHQRFARLMDQCQHRNASDRVISLVNLLANHAFKLPERMLQEKKGKLFQRK